MARGDLGSLPPILKAENKIAVFDPSLNASMLFTPSFDANGVSFGNYSDNHVRIVMEVKAVSVTVLLPPNASKSYHFARGVIGKLSLVAVDKPVKAGAGVIDASETATVAHAADGYVDISLIRDK